MECLGIDPGLDGALCILTGDREGVVLPEWELYLTPTIPKAKGKGRLYDIGAMVKLLHNIKIRNPSVFAVLEKGRAAPGQGVVSMFRFGYGCGLWEGIIAALKIPYMLVDARTWHSKVCKGFTGDPKAKAIQAANSMLPGIDLRKSDRATKPHTGKADAACIALYGKYHFQSKENN